MPETNVTEPLTDEEITAIRENATFWLNPDRDAPKYPSSEPPGCEVALRLLLEVERLRTELGERHSHPGHGSSHVVPAVKRADGLWWHRHPAAASGPERD